MRREVELIVKMIENIEDLENYRIRECIVTFSDLIQGIHEELEELNDTFITQEEFEALKKTGYFELYKLDVRSKKNDIEGYDLEFDRERISIYIILK